MEHQDPMFEEETSVNQAKAWIQENLRILVSVFIVAAIAFGIYSYSQRSQIASDDNLLLDTNGADTEVVAESDADTIKTAGNGVKTDIIVTKELSRETENSFVEQAERGNGTTHLARRALAHSLEKNPDSSLSAEHKIYIEDYLRKNVAHQGGVQSGTSIEFSKTLISQAIEKSKTLNDKQLQNLKKYSARVNAYR
ncbi:MAG: hypothetical protein WA082_04185 [Candidatus Moraniibacteriota bacterium]